MHTLNERAVLEIGSRSGIDLTIREVAMRFGVVVFVAMLIACEGKSGEPQVPVAGKDYHIDVGPKAVTTGAAAACEVTITPQAPWALKIETPFSARLEADAGLTVSKTQLDKADFVDPKAAAKTVRTSCTASAAGEHTLRAQLNFFLCSHEICKRMQEQVSTVVKAK
jgi:hypothetical protein